MEFLLLAAIFLVSGGFLVSAPMRQVSPEVVAPAPASEAAKGGAIRPQPQPGLPMNEVPLPQQEVKPDLPNGQRGAA